jgi:hypothetical protein
VKKKSESERKISGRADLITEQITAVIYTLKESPYGANLSHAQLFKLAVKIIENSDNVAEKALNSIIEAQNSVSENLLSTNKDKKSSL